MIPQWLSEPHVSHSILSQALQGQRGAVAKKRDDEEYDANPITKRSKSFITA